MVNAQCEYIYVDVGAEGRASDGGIWKKSDLYRDLHDPSNPMNIPEPEVIPGMREPLPYRLVADDAFALNVNLMKPYGTKGLSQEAHVFNYRLSRSRTCVENTFGVMASKFRLFRREVEMHPEGVEKVVKAACALHNMLRRECGTTYMPKKFVDHEDEYFRRVAGGWRAENELDNIQPTTTRNASQQARALRDSLRDYFSSPAGQLRGQSNAAFNTTRITEE